MQRLPHLPREYFPATTEAFGDLDAPDVPELLAKTPNPARAARRLASRLVGILHGCLKTHTPYDEATAWGHREILPQSSVEA